MSTYEQTSFLPLNLGTYAARDACQISLTNTKLETAGVVVKSGRKMVEICLEGVVCRILKGRNFMV